MRNVLTFRGPMVRALLAGLLVAGCGVACAQRHGVRVYRPAPVYSVVFMSQNRGLGGQQEQPAPIVRRPPLGAPPGMKTGGALGDTHLLGPDGKGEHLAEWITRHSGMTLQQQQQALDREPGFRELPPDTQMRMHQRLAQLSAMTPVQRQRTLEHTEAMERLTPVQRSEVRGAMQQLGSLPPGQRQQVIRSFLELRMLPPNQRMGMMMSPQYDWLNPAQRTVLTNLIQVAPMLPTQ
jgi:Protein of unknown function (DUF3106)